MIDEAQFEVIKPRFFGGPDERTKWLRRVYWANPFRFLSSVVLFLHRYIFRLGILDGTRGFQFAFLRAAYFYLMDLKLIEYRRTGKRPTVYWPTRGAPHPTLPKTLAREKEKDAERA